MNEALQVLKRGVDSLAGGLQADGELCDPFFHEPSQYGTPYYAFCNAVLAKQLGETEGAVYRERALRGLNASLYYVSHPEIPPRMSSASRETGEVLGINHRDFFWPPILKTYRILKDMGVSEVDALESTIAAVTVEQSFDKRPPNNWASVWLSGEWLRFREGLSPYSAEQIDNWVGLYFANHIRLDLGFYMEPGLPNSYDLFTRYHLADILLNGYEGPWRESLERLMEAGLRRSLAVQLSNGSLASAYRSTGQAWTLGVQCAYFRMASAFFTDRNPELASCAEQAAGRALNAFRRLQREDGPFSPVENTLPLGYRVGYEAYTSDGHYSSLALAFLGAAVLRGLASVQPQDLAPRAPSVYIEHDPTFRALAHNGPYSVQVNTSPSPEYDAFGIVDVTFGPNRVLQFISSARSLESGKFYNIGLAHREAPGRSPLIIAGQMQHDLIEEIAPGSAPASLVVRTRPKGSPFAYHLDTQVDSDGVHIREALMGLPAYKTLLIPYLRDAGTGVVTQVTVGEQEIRLALGSEEILIQLEEPVEHVLNLPHGYENRRGLCGLLRVDFRDPVEEIHYKISIVK